MEFENKLVKCNVIIDKMCQYIDISGIIYNKEQYKNVLLIAANPIDKRASYSGTGLPFPCADIAFQNTKNMYVVNNSGTFTTKFTYPNSYYSANKKKIISSIFFIFEHNDGKEEMIRFELKDMYELRTLINRESRTGPNFYDDKHHILPIATAEEIMIEYAKLKITHKLA